MFQVRSGKLPFHLIHLPPDPECYSSICDIGQAKSRVNCMKIANLKTYKYSRIASQSNFSSSLQEHKSSIWRPITSTTLSFSRKQQWLSTPSWQTLHQTMSNKQLQQLKANIKMTSQATVSIPLTSLSNIFLFFSQS
jgi:hypothetical protein